MRPIHEIALAVSDDWKNPNYAALPYLDAMSDLTSVRDKYYADSARSVLVYFLANASTWRGPVAKAIKAEIKTMLHAA